MVQKVDLLCGRPSPFDLPFESSENTVFQSRSAFLGKNKQTLLVWK